MKRFNLEVDDETYASIREAANEAGIKCAGTQVRIDIQRYYANWRSRRQRRLERSAQ